MMGRRLMLRLLVLGGVLGLGADALGDPEIAVPVEFDYVGTYRLEKRVKMRDGEALPVAMRPIEYRVYTDGISLRFYGGGESGGYTSFSIYRNDGFLVRHSDSFVETVAGVQARSLVGNIMRQTCLTEEKLTITKIPAFSDMVEVTYARRLVELPMPIDNYTAQNDEP